MAQQRFEVYHSDDGTTKAYFTRTQLVIELRGVTVTLDIDKIQTIGVQEEPSKALTITYAGETRSFPSLFVAHQKMKSMFLQRVEAIEDERAIKLAEEAQARREVDAATRFERLTKDFAQWVDELDKGDTVPLETAYHNIKDLYGDLSKEVLMTQLVDLAISHPFTKYMTLLGSIRKIK